MSTISTEKAARIAARFKEGKPVSEKAKQQLARYEANLSPASKPNFKRMISPSGAPLERLQHVLLDHEGATVEYLYSLSHPEAGIDVGVPIVPGGFTPDSTCAQLSSTFSFFANTSGFACATVYGSAGIPMSIESSPPVGPFFFSRVPGVAGVLVAHSTVLTGAIVTTPQYAVVPPADYQQHGLPSTGFDLIGAEARLISASLTVMPVDSGFVQKGTGMITTPGVWSEPIALTNVTYEGIFGQRRNHKAQSSLSGWTAGTAFRAVYVPSRQEQLYYCDAPTITDLTAGLPWATFTATGCTPGQSFRATIVWNFEVNSNTLVTSSARDVSLHGMEALAIHRPSVYPSVVGNSEMPARAVASVAATVAKLNGPSKAASIMKSIGAGLSKAGSVIGPLITAGLPLALAAISGKKGPLSLKGRNPIERNPLL